MFYIFLLVFSAVNCHLYSEYSPYIFASERLFMVLVFSAALLCVALLLFVPSGKTVLLITAIHQFACDYSILHQAFTIVCL